MEFGIQLEKGARAFRGGFEQRSNFEQLIDVTDRNWSNAITLLRRDLDEPLLTQGLESRAHRRPPNAVLRRESRLGNRNTGLGLAADNGKLDDGVGLIGWRPRAIERGYALGPGESQRGLA